MYLTGDVNMYLLMTLIGSLIIPLMIIAVNLSKNIRYPALGILWIILFGFYVYIAPKCRHENILSVHNISLTNTDSSVIIKDLKTNKTYVKYRIGEKNKLLANEWYLITSKTSDTVTEVFNTYIAIEYNLISKEEYVKSHRN